MSEEWDDKMQDRVKISKSKRAITVAKLNVPEHPTYIMVSHCIKFHEVWPKDTEVGMDRQNKMKPTGIYHPNLHLGGGGWGGCNINMANTCR